MLNKLCGRTRQLALVASLMALGGVAQQAQACPVTPMVGTVCVTAINFCPQNYLQAAGQSLPISGNEVLYSLIGVTYGGNGVTNFNLPDLSGRSMVGLGQGTGLPLVSPGGIYGAESVQISQAQMPAHTHAAAYAPTMGGTPQGTVSIGISSAIATTNVASSTANYLSDSTGTGAGRAAIWSQTSSQVATVGGITTSGGVGTVTVGQAGSAAPVSILPPQIGLMHCIANQGVYPQQP